MSYDFVVPFPQASTMQIVNVVSAAAELTANHFANGGLAITVRLGSYFRDPERENMEYWVSGLMVKDTITMQVFADQSPSGNRDMQSVNLFEPMWPLHNTEGKPSTVGEILALHKPNIPPPLQGDFVSIAMSSLSSYYKIAKHVASIFGAMLVKGGNTPEHFIAAARREVDNPAGGVSPRLELAISLTKGMDEQRQVEREVKTTAPRVLMQPVLDENNRPIWDPVKDAHGKPVLEPAVDRVTGRPMVGPNGEIVQRVKMEKRMQPVETDYETVTRDMVTVTDTPYFLQIAKVPEIEYKDTDSVIKNESQYDPTWMLANVLRGECKKITPFHKMDEGQ